MDADKRLSPFAVSFTNPLRVDLPCALTVRPPATITIQNSKRVKNLYIIPASHFKVPQKYKLTQAQPHKKHAFSGKT
jgi:hypothetical protein